MSETTHSIYMIRINDRPLGFRVVALISGNLDGAKTLAAAKFRCHFDSLLPKDGTSPAEVMDEADAYPDNYVEMEFEE